ncbi:MAG: OmpA family protein [Actinomycetota bacterium]|nr:OmpA family protein [Actinomycetota bacterium]
MSDHGNPTALSQDDDAAALIAEFGPNDSAVPGDSDVPATTHVTTTVPTTGHGPSAGRRSHDDDDRVAVYAGWGYLAFLFAVFLGLALVAFGCDDDKADIADAGVSPATTETPAAAALEPAALLFSVDGDKVTLSGAVPDADTAAQLFELAEARYGVGNVVDELTIDDGLTLDGATVSVVGSTSEGDEQPEGLVADVVGAMGLEAGDFDVEFTEVETSAAEIEAAVSPGAVALKGKLPDQPSFDSLVTAAKGVWGEGNVDVSGLSIDDTTTLDGARIRVTGTVDAGDTRVNDFVAAVGATFDGGVEDAVQVDTGAEALARLEASLRERLAATPILFASGSADIDPQSDAILQQAAAAIVAAPGIAVEIVGHTDDQGADTANQALSDARANAVLARLVELGVDPARLSARGAGEAEPVAENTTDAGRAANRRIAFEFAGAAGG